MTTAVTNLDIHDIARSCRTYDVKGYFLVTPLDVQHVLVGRILTHWQDEKSKQYHPYRYEALSRVRLLKDFSEVKDRIRSETGEDPEVVMTDARPFPNSVGYADYRAEISQPTRKRPVCLVFGTGYGISEVFLPEVHRILAPVNGPEDSEGWEPPHDIHEKVGVEGIPVKRKGYNHLSVRSAVAIILDRLAGT